MRVLVVEDDERVARLIERALEGDGHAVDHASTGEDAIRFASERTFDVIVLDVVIPPPDGIEVTRRLRDTENWTPILLLTGKADVEDRVRGLDAGAGRLPAQALLDLGVDREDPPSTDGSHVSVLRNCRSAICGSIPRRARSNAAASPSTSPRRSSHCSSS